jgi:hypothetical protein
VLACLRRFRLLSYSHAHADGQHQGSHAHGDGFARGQCRGGHRLDQHAGPGRGWSRPLDRGDTGRLGHHPGPWPGPGRPHKALNLAKTSAFRQFAGAALAADPAGGLWASWFTGNGAPASLYVRNSNAAATKWGRSVRVSLPSGISRILKVYISAQNSRVDVLALLTRHGKTAYWSTQVR